MASEVTELPTRLAPASRFVFDHARLVDIAERLSAGYAAAEPFPNAVIDDFLPPAAAEQVLQEFPAPDSPVWLDWKNRDLVHQPKKLGIGHISRMGPVAPFIQEVLAAFNSFPMIDFLERLSGIEGLIPDPHYVGGGLHQILPGGKLAIHSDFSFHAQLKLYRRINLLLYLNRDWRPEYAGRLELWDAPMRRPVRSIEPIFNRCVIFNTDRTSFHGHPDPLAAPEGVTRKSIALYYYTAQPKPGDSEHRDTLWQARPAGD